MQAGGPHWHRFARIAVASSLAALVVSACSSRDATAPQAAPSPEPPAPAPTAEPARAETAEPKVLVRVELLGPSELGRAALAVHHQVPEGWHIYWKNPGESGLATRVTATVPDGPDVLELRYPAPEVIDAPGGISTYGYEGTATLFLPLAASPPETGALSVRSKWLVCREACVKDETTIALDWSDLSMRDRPDQATRASIARVPRPHAELIERADIRWAEGNTLQIAAKPGGPALTEFFPYETDPAMLAERRIEARTIDLVYRIPNTPDGLGPQGVIAFAEGSQPRFFELVEPWPTTAKSEEPS